MSLMSDEEEVDVFCLCEHVIVIRLQSEVCLSIYSEEVAHFGFFFFFCCYNVIKQIQTWVAVRLCFLVQRKSDLVGERYR